MSKDILIACDSFKDALPALEVCKALQVGLLNANPDFQTTVFPLADGGEGTMDVLCYQSAGAWIEVDTFDPLRRPMKARYGLSQNGKTAFVEMAAASGIQLLKSSERTATKSDTFGTGLLIKNALARGVEKILLGIGGSATNDAGAGMASALGYRFLDVNNEAVEPCGANLHLINRIKDSDLALALRQIKIEVICDVDNPLHGPRGAAAVYGPQKGASPQEVVSLDAGLVSFGGLLEAHFQQPISQIPGAGAAGGMGAGCLAFLGAKLCPGIEAVMDQTQFAEAVANHDLVITGEGKIDQQTLNGKLIAGVSKVCQAHQVPCIAVCGALLADIADLQKLNLQAAFSIARYPSTLETALAETQQHLTHLGYSLGKLLE